MAKGHDSQPCFGPLENIFDEATDILGVDHLQVASRPGLHTEPSSSRSSILDSQEVGHPTAASDHSHDRHDDLIDLNDEHPSTSTTGLLSSGHDIQGGSNTASRRGSMGRSDQASSQE